MRMLDLEPQLVAHTGGGNARHVTAIADANGIMFVCPTCLAMNSMRRPGVHSILCWDPTIPKDITPGPGRWWLRGASLEDLTLEGVGSSSVLLTGPGCGAHFFVTRGQIAMC